MLKYQSTYHDIDIGELHRKVQYLESECDVMTRLNTRLTAQIETLTANLETYRKKLKQHKEREKREREAAAAALREQQELEEARANMMLSPTADEQASFSSKRVQLSALSKLAALRSNNGQNDEDSSDYSSGEEGKKAKDKSESDLALGENNEMPTYKKAVRDQYEHALNHFG